MVIRFQLQLSYEQYSAVYQGLANSIIVKAEDGRRIQFPAKRLHRFLTPNGIQGYFELTLTDQYRFIDLQKISD